MLGLDRFELDRNLLARDNVDAKVNVTWKTSEKRSAHRSGCERLVRKGHTKRAAANLLANAVLAAYTEIGRHCKARVVTSTVVSGKAQERTRAREREAQARRSVVDRRIFRGRTREANGNTGQPSNYTRSQSMLKRASARERGWRKDGGRSSSNDSQGGWLLASLPTQLR